MAYERINWQNEPSEATALNDVNLNKMDSAIYELDGKATATETAITALQDGKVDKVNGKGLSQVDNVTVTQHVAYGTVVSTIKTYGQDGTEVTSQVCNGIVIDSALSDSSTNPVQNKVVKSAIDEKSTVAISDTLETGTTLANITIDGTTTAIKGSDIEVDEELSPTSANPVENKAIYDALNNLLPSKTVSGNPISISDASGFNAKALTVSMNPIQDLNGYDHPWAGGAWKNKCPINTVSLVRGASESVVVDFDNPLPIGSYITSYTYSGTSTVTRFVLLDESGNTILDPNIASAGSSPQTINVTSPAYKVRIYIGSSQASGATANITDLMVRLSTVTDATFAPYANICPISGRTEASVNRGSVDIVTLYRGQIQASGAYNGDARRICNVNNAQMNVYKLKKGTHTLKFNKLNDSAPDLVECTVLTKNDNFEIVDNFATAWHSLPYTFELTADAYVYFTARKDYNTILNTADYKTLIIDETHTHQYSETIYGGVDDFVNGGLTNEWGYIASYDGEALPGEWISDRDAYAPDTTPTTGAEVAYRLATPTTIETSAEEITLLKGNNVLSTDADDMELKYSVSLDSLLA